MTADGLPILSYHAIGTSRGVTVTDPVWFAETLAALVETGHRAVDLDDWVAQGRPAVASGFAVAFDDGLRSILRVADVVHRHRVPATVFLVTDRMGRDNAWPGQPPGIPREPLLAWSDLDALHEAGFRFAAHGRRHARLDLCDDTALESELRGSRDAIEQETGRPCRLLAYPYGRSTARVRRAAAHHFAAAFGTRLDAASAGQDRFDLARIDAYYLRSPRALERLTTGRWHGWLRRRRALRGVRKVISGWPGQSASVPRDRGRTPGARWRFAPATPQFQQGEIKRSNDPSGVS
jgi:peptidoglycan/xylan/chitin deacetylase (PgdA/CDA1 family)